MTRSKLIYLLLLIALVSCSKQQELTYKEIVACAGIATTINGNAIEMFDPKAEDREVLAEKMERITDSILVNAEKALNQGKHNDIETYKKDIHRYAVETQKAMYSGSTDYYKSSLYISQNCAALETTGLRLDK